MNKEKISQTMFVYFHRSFVCSTRYCSRLQYLCSHTVLGLAQDVTNFDQWLNLVLVTTTTRGGFFNMSFIIITYISNVFTSIGNILSKISKKKCFSIALRHTLVVLEMH